MQGLPSFKPWGAVLEGKAPKPLNGNKREENIMFDEGISRRGFLGLAGLAAGAATIGFPDVAQAADVTLRYGHMNTPTSINGQQARWFAQEVSKNTGGRVSIQVFPSSQLGSIKELAECRPAKGFDADWRRGHCAFLL